MPDEDQHETAIENQSQQEQTQPAGLEDLQRQLARTQAELAEARREAARYRTRNDGERTNEIAELQQRLQQQQQTLEELQGQIRTRDMTDALRKVLGDDDVARMAVRLVEPADMQDGNLNPESLLARYPKLRTLAVSPASSGANAGVGFGPRQQLAELEAQLAEAQRAGNTLAVTRLTRLLAEHRKKA